MKISEQWLHEWVKPGVDAAKLGHRLTMAGLELAGIEGAAPAFTGVKVGQIEVLEPHPNTKKCQMTSVNVGGERNLDIVCAAKNISQGDKVVVAVDGALLPGDFAICTRKVYDTASEGMICSLEELGLAESADGVLILPADAPVGEDFRVYAGLDDNILEIELTPNRGDCLSMRGVAREAGVLFQTAVTEVSVEPVVPKIDDQVTANVSAPDLCPRYLLRVIKGINPEASAPLWLTERLRRGGIRPIHPVVDVMNYVMLELGQPMHAFDLAKVDGDIEVRLAKPGEALDLLDGGKIDCQENTLLIADQKQPLAVAGIMGGQDSAVSDATTDILLESAHFTQLAIAGRARQYGLVTDSSQRFERGVDPELPAMAMERATTLLQQIVGGEVGPLVVAEDQSQLADTKPVALREEKLSGLLGMQIAAERVTDILQRLGLSPEYGDGVWVCTAPSHRFDISIEEDLVEEVARVYGYDNIDNDEAWQPISFTALPETKLGARTFRDTLCALGYQEVITYSFVDPKLQQLTEPKNTPLALKNPISQDMGVMRTSLMQGLLQTLRYNQNRQQDAMRLFEVGLCYSAAQDEAASVADLVQEQRIAGLLCGEIHELHWQGKEAGANFYDLKGDLETLLGLTLEPAAFSFEAGEHEMLHPGQTAVIKRNGNVVGYLGALHPRVAQATGVKNNSCYLFELTLSALEARRLPQFTPLSKFPSIRRDLSMVLSEEVTANQIRQVVGEAGGDLVTKLQIFDLYRGDNIEKSKKSMALGLTLQHQSRTLIDSEVNLTIDNIVEALQTKLSALMRD